MMENKKNERPQINLKRLVEMQKLIGQRTTRSISPVGRWLDGKLIAIEYGSMKMEFEVRADMTNPMGILHGGISSAILDELVGTTVYTLGREYAFTSVNLNCDFLHAGRLGELIIATAQVVREGKNIIHVEGQITNSEHKIITKCTSNLIQTSLKIPE